MEYVDVWNIVEYLPVQFQLHVDVESGPPGPPGVHWVPTDRVSYYSFLRVFQTQQLHPEM